MHDGDLRPRGLVEGERVRARDEHGQPERREEPADDRSLRTRPRAPALLRRRTAAGRSARTSAAPSSAQHRPATTVRCPAHVTAVHAPVAAATARTVPIRAVMTLPHHEPHVRSTSFARGRGGV